MPKKLYTYIFFLFAITLALRCVLLFYYNNNMGGIETNVVYGIQRLLLGQPLYQNPSAGSYAVMQYTPLYYYMAAGTARMAGVGYLDVQSIYTLCRALALLCNLLTVAAAAGIISSWGYGRRQSLLYATPVLVVLTTHYFLRGDSLHLLLFTAAVYGLLLFYRKDALPWLLLSAVFAAACVMTKQNGILVCGITNISLLARRKMGAVILYTATVVVAALAIAWLCTGVDWPALYQNACLGLKNGTDLSFLYRIFISRFFIELVPCYVLGGVLVWLVIKKKVTAPLFSTLTLGVALSWLFAVVTGLKIGSSNNYFVEFLVLLVVLVPGLWASDAAKQVPLRAMGINLTVGRLAGIAFFILLTSKTVGLFSAVVIERSIRNNKEQYMADQALYHYFINELHLQKGAHILFTERNFLDNVFIDYTVMPTKDVSSETYLADSNTYDYLALTKGLNNGLVQYIVADARNKDLNRWQEQLPFMVIDTSKFEKIAEKEGYSIYKWNYNSNFRNYTP